MRNVYGTDPAIQSAVAHKPRHNHGDARMKASGRSRSNRVSDWSCWPDAMGVIVCPLGHRTWRSA
jgi:hypothetical protein